MKVWYHNLKVNWKEVFSDRKFLVKFILNLVLCYSIYMLGVQFLVLNRTRPGVVLDDPIQRLFTPYNFSSPIFLLTYACIVIFVIYVIVRPHDFYYGARAFTAVFVVRVAFIYLVPLTPPPNSILLKDPFLDSVIWGNMSISNDLFFSGHVADICTFIFLCRSSHLRNFMIGCVVAVAIMVVWQYVHYTADVIAAPFFSYGAYVLFAKRHIQESSVPDFSSVQLN